MSSYSGNKVLRYDGTNGAYIDAFISAGLSKPYALTFGPDGNLYVGLYSDNEVHRYDAATGAFIDVFVSADSGGLDTPEQIVFGPDGNLYVASFATDEVLRYDGSTGAFIDVFVSAGSGGLDKPTGLAFGPDRNLYVAGEATNNVLRYNGATGTFIDEYVAAGSGGLATPALMAFLPEQQVTVKDTPILDLDANDSAAPGNDYALTYTEDDAPTAIADSDTDLSDFDSTSFDHVTLAVSGLLDDDAEELQLDGTTFTLATPAAGQNTTGLAYTVDVTTGAGTATVTITKQGGGTFTEVETETLIEAIQYRHSNGDNPSDGDRAINVTVNDGTTDSAAAITTINVNPVNDAPIGVPCHHRYRH